MALHTTTDVAEIKQLVAATLADDPVANTVFSSIAAGLDAEDAAGWAAHPVGEPLVLAARSQRNTPVAVVGGWDDVSELAGAIAELDPPASGVGAEPTVIDALVTGIGRAPTYTMTERLFRLDDLVPPTGVAGATRPATQADAGVLLEWFCDFTEEVFERRAPVAAAQAQLEYALAHGRCWLWTVNGEVVSFAHRRAVADGVARIGPVYTPPDARGHGYASAATAAAAGDILDDGAVPCLYTDLANPTSNKIYQAIGFYPVLDRCLVRFD